MSDPSSPVERVRDDVARLSARGLDVVGFFDEAGRILRKAVAFDGFCSMTVDPATMLLTSHVAHDSVRPEDVPRLPSPTFSRAASGSEIPASWDRRATAPSLASRDESAKRRPDVPQGV